MDEKQETPRYAGQKIIILAGRRRGSSHLIQHIIKLMNVPDHEQLFIDAFEHKAHIKPGEQIRLLVIDNVFEDFQRCMDCLTNPNLTVVIRLGSLIVSPRRLEELLSFSYLVILAGTRLEKKVFDRAFIDKKEFVWKIRRPLEKLNTYEFLIMFNDQYQAYPALTS